MVLLLGPLLKLLFDSDYFLNQVNYESFWQEMENVHLDTAGMEETTRAVYQKEYEKAIAGDIALMAGEEIVVRESSVQLSEDYHPVEIVLSVSLAGQEEGIHIEKVTLKDNSREYPAVQKLKKKIMEFYEVREDQVQILVREG